MELSPLAVYLVLQADKLIIAAMVASVASGVGVFAFYLTGILTSHDRTDSLSESAHKQKIIDDSAARSKRLFLALVLFSSMAAFMPNTTTLAAMLILPPLVNDGIPAVAGEARELYDLAKRALEDAVEPTNGIDDAL